MDVSFKFVWRVSDRIWGDLEQFEELLKVLTKHGDTADEFALFIAEPSNYVYDPLDRVEKLMEVFSNRAARLRALGKTVGINLWPTFGSGSEYEKSPLRPPMPFAPMVGWDSRAEDSIACPLSPEFLDYTRRKYELVARAGPDFIWVDDDTRFTHLNGHPYPCFCDRCVGGFEDGRYPDRETLTAALNNPAERELRRRWSAYGADRLARYCAQVRAAVDAVDPAIDTPFMTVGPTHTTYAGDFIEKCMAALRSRRGRPGHGFYWDERPGDMLRKAMEAGRQTVRYPGSAAQVYYEEESCPYVYLDKAVITRVDETWLALAAGCTGVAFNHLPAAAQPASPGMFAPYLREMDEFHRLRPAWTRYVEFARGLPWQGFWPADDAFLMAGMDCAKGWFRENDPAYDIARPESVGTMGLPLTADRKAACATLLSGKILETYEDGELRVIFSRGVIIDGEALEALERRGYGRWAGVRLGASRMGAWERATAHPFNGPFEGYQRTGVFDPAYELEPLDDDVETMAVSVDAYGTQYGPCMTLYQNELGGRVAVCGYSPWRFLGLPYKLWQFRSLSEWMGGPAAIYWPDPARIAPIAPFVRGDGERAAALLINASLDESVPCELLLRGVMTDAELLEADGSLTPLPAAREGDALRVKVPAIGPWRTLTILSE